MPSIVLIANNPKGKYKGKKLKKLIGKDDLVMGFNVLSWYKNKFYPLDIWFLRHTRNNYAGFDNNYVALKQSAAKKAKYLLFINQNNRAIRKIRKRNKMRKKEYEILEKTEWLKPHYGLKKKPSTGLIGLHYALEKYPEYDIKMINYTFKGGKQHDWAGEKTFCKKLVDEGKLKLYS